MIGTLEIIVGLVFALILGRLFLYSIKTSKKNKKVLADLKPIRSLDKNDIRAMHFIEIDSNLSVDPIPFLKMNPKRLIHKELWKFESCNFEITSYTRGGKTKVILHHFYVSINNEVIEVKVPEVFIPYLELYQQYKNKTIEILYSYDHFILFNIKDEIGYLSLYEKLTKNNDLKRQPTKEELDAFMFSIWNSVWGIMAPVCFLLVLPLMNDGIETIITITKFSPLFLLFALLFLFITVPFCIAYKKRKKYFYSRKIHTLKGRLSFDEKKHMYEINYEELRLHRKWKKILKKKKLPIDNVEMEALLHTYDNLDQKAIKQFQPVSIKSSTLNLNETILKSTRSWGTVFLYWLCFGIIALFPIRFIPEENLFMNPVHLFKITDNYLFTLTMTLIWWTSIIIAIYLSYLLINRIKGHYFDD